MNFCTQAWIRNSNSVREYYIEVVLSSIFAVINLQFAVIDFQFAVISLQFAVIDLQNFGLLWNDLQPK